MKINNVRKIGRGVKIKIVDFFTYCQIKIFFPWDFFFNGNKLYQQIIFITYEYYLNSNFGLYYS